MDGDDERPGGSGQQGGQPGGGRQQGGQPGGGRQQGGGGQRGGARPPGGDSASRGESGGGGFPWGKSCLGCGCLTLLLLVCGAGGFFGYQAYQWRQMEEGIQVRKEVTQKRKLVVESRNIGANLEEPLTRSEVEAFESTIEQWKSSEPFKHFEQIQQTLDEQSDEPSVFEIFEGIWMVWSAASTFQQLGVAYVEAIEANGGIEEHYRRLQRIGGVLAAAHEVATGRHFENTESVESDELAELLYQNHGEVTQAYSDQIEAVRAEQSSFEELAGEGTLGIYALAALPKESFAPWYEISSERRKKVMNLFAWTLAAETLSFGGLAFPIEFDQTIPIPG